MTFSGILPKTTIAVDNFVASAEVWFLSHFHADHFLGLNESFVGGTIYCSELTKSFLLKKFELNPTAVISLEVGKVHSIRSPRCTPSIFTVQLFPAHHCPGSVMILFEGSFGKYLHTGDFRFHPEMEAYANYITQGEKVSCLFLDTTFASPFWEEIPTKSEAIEQILTIIDNAHPQGDVFLECDMLGTEDILVAIHNKYNTKIHVEQEKHLKFSCMPTLQQMFTTSSQATRFHVCRAGTLGNLSPTKQVLATNRQFVSDMKPKSRNSYNQEDGKQTVHHQIKSGWGTNGTTLYIKPSSQWFGSNQGAKLIPIPRQDLNGVWHVLYSIHSSFSEIRSFVSLISPQVILPIVACDPDILTTFIPYLSPKDENLLKRKFDDTNKKTKTEFQKWNQLKTKIPRKRIKQDIKPKTQFFPLQLEDEPIINQTTSEQGSEDNNQQIDISGDQQSTIQTITTQSISTLHDGDQCVPMDFTVDDIEAHAASFCKVSCSSPTLVVSSSSPLVSTVKPAYAMVHTPSRLQSILSDLFPEDTEDTPTTPTLPFVTSSQPRCSATLFKLLDFDEESSTHLNQAPPPFNPSSTPPQQTIQTVDSNCWMTKDELNKMRYQKPK